MNERSAYHPATMATGTGMALHITGFLPGLSATVLPGKQPAVLIGYNCLVHIKLSSSGRKVLQFAAVATGHQHKGGKQVAGGRLQ